ncbi:MAG: 4-(cytidine 5'-diphospho)-2-C-methyl-D-erythritol kinase [Peptococcia bacterium]|jgi:4-diphosphocytidyl-2-C-methyl-D-erythritol kinase
MRKIICKAYGKINLTLDVLGKRVDGYHEIFTLFQGISLYDDVYLAKGDEEGIFLTCNLSELSMGPENLAYRAAQLLKEKFPQISGLKIHLTKRIPLAAGLAGGSTDAAAVLWGVNHLYNLHLSPEELGELGARLGSDVPFCLYPFTAIGTGRGEKLRACGPCPELWIVLLKPPFHVSTKEVYEHLAQVKIEKRPELNKVLHGLQAENKKQIYSYLGNVLEYSTFALYPQLKVWAQEIAELGARKVIMSGSGPSLLAFVENRKEAVQLATSFNKPGWKVEVVRTINREDLRGRMIVDE